MDILKSMSINNPEALFSNIAVIPEEEKVKTLVEMGFKEDHARIALTKTHNAMQASTEYLLSTSEEDLRKEFENQEKTKNSSSSTSETSLSSMIARVAQLESMSTQIHSTVISKVCSAHWIIWLAPILKKAMILNRTYSLYNHMGTAYASQLFTLISVLTNVRLHFPFKQANPFLVIAFDFAEN